ncbi:hypothetical protein Tco_0323555 [Tanacetum coccineum]
MDRIVGPSKSDIRQTATYGKIRVDDDLYDLRSVEAEFPAIVIDNTVTPQDALPCKSQVRILQKSQENGQNRTNTDTGTDKECTRAGRMLSTSSIVNSRKPLVNIGQLTKDKTPKLTKTALIVKPNCKNGP